VSRCRKQSRRSLFGAVFVARLSATPDVCDVAIFDELNDPDCMVRMARSDNPVVQRTAAGDVKTASGVMNGKRRYY